MSTISHADKRCSCGGNKEATTCEVVCLPVAPQVTAKTRFSSSDPKKIAYLMPHEAIQVLDTAIKERERRITMAAIAGPGDPLAVPDTTLKTIELVRQRYPELGIGLKTLGVGGERFAVDLARAGVSYVELEVNAVSVEILEKLYAWIRPGLKTLKIGDAADLLVREQKNTVPALRYHNIDVTIITTLYPGYNIDHVGKISATMMELGATGIALQAYEPECGAEVSLIPPDRATIAQAQEIAGQHLPVVKPLFVTRPKGDDLGKNALSGPVRPSKSRPNVAVVSTNGIDVDQHLGKADRLLIYGPRSDGLACLLETRKAPAVGEGLVRWQKLAAALPDCFAVLAKQAGQKPREVLAEGGITLILTDENIEGLVEVLYGGGKKGTGRRGGR